MMLSKLEIAVLSEFFKWHKMTVPTFDRVMVKERCFTGAGFMTLLYRCEDLKLHKKGAERVWGKVGALLNNKSVDSGYLIFIEEGYIDAIEGYTYGDDWPEDINNFAPYFILWKQGNR